VTNVARHAGARRVHIQVKCSKDWLELEVYDNGCGFDSQHASAGNGLKSMRRRAEALRGTLTIESRPGAGATVLLRAPLGSNRMSM
jgi:signal transduction histidine kinase